MSEPNNVGLAAAVAGGYVLGRTKKGRMAITAAALLLGRRLSPRDAVVGGVRRLPGVPAGGDGGDDGEAGADEGHGRSAIRRKAGALASRAANRRLTALTEALHTRTLALGAAAGPQDDEDSEDSEDSEDTAGPDDEPEEPQRTAKKTAAPGKRAPARKKAPSTPGAAAGRKTPARKRPAKPAPPAKKTPAKKAAVKKTAAKKSTEKKAAVKKTAPARKSAARPQRER